MVSRASTHMTSNTTASAISSAAANNSRASASPGTHNHGDALDGVGDNQQSKSAPPSFCRCCGMLWSTPSLLLHQCLEGCLLPISKAFLASVVWRILLVLGNFILLFGNPIQMLALPAAADPAMDVIYCMVLAAFCVDMVFRSVAVPGYFGISVYRIYPFHPSSSSSQTKNASSGSSSTGGSTTGGGKDNASKKDSNHLLNENCAKCMEACFGWLRCIQMGSFLFWCDLFSTFTLLYDISFTNPNDYDMVTLDISLLAGDMFPTTQGVDKVNMANPWEFNTGLMITILKTAHVVRFVRSQAVATLISRVNWYWPVQKLNLVLAYLDCCSRRHYYSHDDHADGRDDEKGMTKNNGVGPNPHGGMNRGMGHGDPKSASKTSSAGAPGVEEYQQRRSSWGGLGMATLTAVKAHRLAQEAEEEKTKGFLGGFVKMLRGVGILKPDKTAFQRHLAATKIQRAWRKAVARHHNSDHFRDELGVLDEMEATGAGTSRKAGSMTKKSQASNKKLLPKSFRKMSIYSGMDATAFSASISQKLKYATGGEHAAQSQVGGAMRELTGQRVAIGIILALLLTATFTYVEQDATRPATMIILHAQTTGTSISQDGTTTVTRPPPKRWTNMALGVARQTSIPELYRFDLANGSNQTFQLSENDDEDLRERERMQIIIESTNFTNENNVTMKSVGWFAYRQERRNEALVQLFSTIFILLLWLFGVTAFAGPVMVLVVLPIERMVRLLGMLMVDPLGYQSTSRYRRFVAEEDALTKNTRWTKEVLKGMETSFLMSTILRIGSLMKVGFGSAGVEIIRKNLEKKQGGDLNLLTSKGLTVSCIFLFCDIRQFTDATECLQEEVFVFTNRIAGVVHSFCHSYGGSANKNVGDAFLCSWLLDDPPPNDGGFGGGDQLYAKSNQADKCLLCVVKIIMALHHDSYYIETMSEAPRQRLLAKLEKRPGPVVQMGCGLHAGKAVQGAIGSERKIDATYVSEAVEMSEFLESSTKKYGLKMLMSNAFHTLLHANNKQRCRLVDQIVIPTDDDDEDELAIMYERDDIVELYTYDMDIDALWTAPPVNPSKSATDRNSLDGGSMSDADSRQGHSDRRGEMKKVLSARREPGSTRLARNGRRMSISGMLTSKSAINASNTSGASKGPLDGGSVHDFGGVDHNSAAMKTNPGSTLDPKGDSGDPGFRKPELILPTGPALYNPTIWRSEQMFRIRKKYLDGLFFHNYSQGLQSFYHREWDRATQSFNAILAKFEDGPSRYFLSEIEKYDGKPPPNFRPYGMA